MGAISRIRPQSRAYDENLSDEHQLTLFGDGQVTPELLMRKDALALFDIPTSAAISYTEKLRSALSQALSLARKTRIDSHSLAIMSGRFQHGLNVGMPCLSARKPCTIQVRSDGILRRLSGLFRTAILFGISIPIMKEY